MADKPSVLYPGDPIKLSKQDAEFLGHALVDRISRLEKMHADYFKDLAVWWRWYDAVPRFKEKNWPFKNASNLIVPLIQAQSLALTNRLISMVFSNDNRIWMHRTENQDQAVGVREFMRFQNWAANGNQFDFRTPISDGLNELVPIGMTVWSVNWHNDRRHVFTGQRGRKLESQEVLFSRGPLVEHVPREQILWDPGYRVSEAPEVIREFEVEFDDLLHRAEQGEDNGWIVENVEAIRGDNGPEGPGRQVKETKELQIDNLDRSKLDKPHDIREVHISFPVFQTIGRGENLALPGGKKPGSPTLGLVFVVHRKTGKLLQAKADPYNFGRKPFVDAYFQKRPGRGFSVGLCKKLQHMQSAMTTTLNQALDSRTRANAIYAKTSSRDLANRELDPGVALHVPVGTEYEVLDLSKNVLNDMNLFNVVNILAERLTGQADPVMGRESRSGGHPSPATSTLALLGQSDQMISTLRMSVRTAVSEMGEMIASLYQDFLPDPMELAAVLGPEDATSVGQLLAQEQTLLGRTRFDVVGMSRNSNPEAEIQKNLQLMAANVNYWSFVGQIIQTAIQAAGQGFPQALQIAERAIQAQSKLQELLLSAGDVDDVEDFILQIQRGLSGSAQDAALLGQQLGGLAQGAGNVQESGVAGPNGSAQGGAAIAPGAFS